MSADTIKPWNPMEKELTFDQKCAYDQLRNQQAFAKSERLGWTALRYDDVVSIAQNPEVFSNSLAWAAIDPNLTKNQRAIPLALDPPEHSDYRNLLRELFIPKRVATFEVQAREKASRMIQDMIERGSADVVAEFTDPYPVQSLCAFLGWDDDRWAEIKRWSRDLTAARAAGRREEAEILFNQWFDYINSVLQARKSNPQNDVTSWLIGMGENGSILCDEQIISILRLLLVAGHGTTTTALGNMIEYLATHPDKQQELRDRPDILPNAIEEMLRYNSPQMVMPRRTRCPASVNGQHFEEGETIWLNFLAANRDPKKFENPNECNFERRPNRHIAFGSGIHTCLGSTFGRMEIKIGLEELLKRTSSFHLDPKGELSYNTFPHNQPKHMDIIFKA